MSRFYAHRVMDAAGTVGALPMGNKSQITSERQARELARVEPARREEVTMGPTGPKDVARVERVTARSLGTGKRALPNG